MFTEDPTQPSTLTSEQYEQDVAACMQLLSSNQKNAEELSRKLKELSKEVHQKEFEKGIDYYDSKNLLMLQYLTELHFYVMFRLEGKSLADGEGFNLYKNLLYLKTLLMKLGPIERKLEYKVNKILKEASHQIEITPSAKPVSANKEEDIRKYKPHPENLARERTTDTGFTPTGEKKYVAPKLTSTLMQKDELNKRSSLKEERRKAHLRRELRGVFMDGEEPEDVNMQSIYEKQLAKRQQEKERYEEEFFTRLPDTKKDRRLTKQAQKKSQHDDVGDLSELKKVNELLRYEKMIEADYEKEEKLSRTLGTRKKIRKER